MKELDLLQGAYSKAMDESNVSYTNLNLLQKQRISTYRKYREMPESVSGDEVLRECETYLEYLQSILISSKTSHTNYPYVVSIASTMHNPTMSYLSDEEKVVLINNEIVMLDTVMKTLKLNPMQAGRKVKYTKSAIGELKELKQEFDSPMA